MAQLTQTNNYAGDVVDFIYEVLTTGFQSKEKGLIRSEVGINEDRFIPNIRATANPIGAYSATVPSETATVTYAERTLSPNKMNIYMEYVPSGWQEIWPMYMAAGNMTNLALNPEVLRATMAVLSNAINKQLENLVWQGDTGGATAISYFDGLIKLALADSNVVDVTNIGVITTSNVFDVFEDLYQAIPAHLMGDPNFKFITSTTDFRKAQVANLAAKSATTGFLDNGVEQSYLGVPIVHTAGIPENTILGTIATQDRTSNLVFGCWVDPAEEMGAVRIGRILPMSDTWGLRINLKAAVQYVDGTSIILYVGS